MTVWGWLGFGTIVYLAALRAFRPRWWRRRRRRRRPVGTFTTSRSALGPATLLLVVWSDLVAAAVRRVYF
jgi:hypothetical protein